MRQLLLGLAFALASTLAHADARSDCVGSFSSTAVQDCTRWIIQEPNNSEAYYSRGLAYNLIGKINPAIADFSQAIILNPNYANAYSARAEDYRRTGKFDVALNDYNKAVEFAPNFKVYGERADFYFGRAQYQNAIADYTRALDLMGPEGWFWYIKNRGLAYEKVGDKPKAIADLQRARADPDSGANDQQILAALRRLGAA
ncbi:MAG: tetratricopeptide repeat protein [Pseudomonadota bacterium]